jgi:hypothetical protein
MTAILDQLKQASNLLAEIARVGRASLTDAELVQLLDAEETAGRLVDTCRALSAGEVAERSRFELGSEGLSFKHAHRKPVHFIEQVTRTSQAEANRRMRVGLAIRPRYGIGGEPCPPERAQLADAMASGQVGLDSAAAIVTCLKQATGGSEASFSHLEAAEISLAELATQESADLVWNAGRAWRDRLDPDGLEPRYEAIRARRGITAGGEHNGIKDFHLRADPISASVIEAAMADSMVPGAVPRFLSEEDAARATQLVASESGELVEMIVDPRTFEQKRFDAVIGVLAAGLRETRDAPADLRTIATVNATVSLKDLQSDPMFRNLGVGHLEGSDEVLPMSAIREMVCDSGFSITILDEGFQPLALGRRERSHSRAQRRAMAARDGHRCVVPGCKVPASRTQAHHVVQWSHGGATDVDNGVLLCPAHHHALHGGAFEIRMIDRLPYIRLPADAGDERAWKRAGRTVDGLIIAA